MASKEIEVDENLQWEIEEGIPQRSDPFIQKYFQGRDALVAQEDKHRSGQSSSLYTMLLDTTIADTYAKIVNFGR